MYGYIDEIDFHNEDAEKYWSFPKNYKGDKKAETKAMIMSCSYFGSEKKDGHYARLIKDEDGNLMLQGRTPSVDGTYHNKIEWVPQCNKFFEMLPKGTCLLGELYFPNQRGSRKVTTILGCLKEKALEKQEGGEKIHFYVFDVWAYNGKSYLEEPIEKRIETLNLIKSNAETNSIECVDFADYLQGETLWTALGNILNTGGEGVVITKRGSRPEPGKRTARKTLKVKMEIEQNIDAFLTGNYKPATRLYNGKEREVWCYWENIRTGEKFNTCKFNESANGEPYEPVTKAYYYGWASSIEFAVYKDDKVVPIGWISGIPDSLKEEITTNVNLVGKVAELTCMEIEKTTDGYSLRHGKIVNWRPDKKAEDCEFSQFES